MTATGAVLPLILVPAGFALIRALGITLVTPRIAAVVLPAAMAGYYLLWKHVVDFFNRAVDL